MSKSFDNIIIKAINMIEEHNKEIEQKWGIGYNSEPEFYGVIKEEIEEAREEQKDLDEKLENIWAKIRKDEPISKQDCANIILIAQHLIAEAVQVGAVAGRMMHGIAEKEKKEQK